MRDNSMDFAENTQFYEPKDSQMFKGLSRTHHEAILSNHQRTEERRGEERKSEGDFFFFYLLFDKLKVGGRFHLEHLSWKEIIIEMFLSERNNSWSRQKI